MEADELIADLGTRLGIGLQLDDGGVCSFSADGMVVTINHIPELYIFTLTGDLGEPPPERLELLYKSLLEANHLFACTAGATLSCDQDTGHIALCRILPIQPIDGEMLFKLVERFVSTLDTWTKLIANFRDAASDRADMLNATQNPVNSISMLELRV